MHTELGNNPFPPQGCISQHFLLPKYNWQINQSSPRLHQLADLASVLTKPIVHSSSSTAAATGKFHRFLPKFKVAIVSDKVSPDIVILKQCNNISLLRHSCYCFLPPFFFRSMYLTPSIHCFNNRQIHQLLLKWVWSKIVLYWNLCRNVSDGWSEWMLRLLMRLDPSVGRNIIPRTASIFLNIPTVL